MSIFLVVMLFALLLTLSMPTLRQIASTLREISAYVSAAAESSTGDIVKTIDLSDPSSSR